MVTQAGRSTFLERQPCPLSQGGGTPASPKYFWDCYTGTYIIRNSNQSLDGDQTRCEEILTQMTMNADAQSVCRSQPSCQKFSAAAAGESMNTTTWPMGSGYKVTTYLESQTHSFLLTILLLSGYDDDYSVIYSRALPLFKFSGRS